MGEAKAAGWTGGQGCYNLTSNNSNEVWQVDNELAIHLPILAVQIIYIVFATRFFYYLLRPINLPCIVAEVMAGFTLSAALLGNTFFFNIVYPMNGVLSIETISHMGIVYNAFLCGLEMNLDAILKASKKATAIALSAIIIPMVLGSAIFKLYHKFYVEDIISMVEDNTVKGLIAWNLSLSVTGFPVLARLLADLKLLYTGLGQAALTSAMIINAYNWAFFILLMPFAMEQKKAIVSLLSTLLFILFCFFVLRPPLFHLINKKTNEDSWDNQQLLYVMIGVFMCAFITDLLGTQSIMGAFVFGLILPHGKFADMMMEKSDDFVSGLLSPLFFAGTGMRLNLKIIASQKHLPIMLLVILLLCLSKVVSTIFVTGFFGMSIRDGTGLGLLLNTKGVLAMITLNIAWDKQILSRVSFSIMVSAIVIMTIVVSPIINILYKPRNRFKQYKLRTIQNLRIDAELRVLACVHNARQVPGMINLLEACNATRVSPLQVFALHLVELTGRATALLAAQVELLSSQDGQNLTKTQAELESINNAFYTFKEGNGAVRVDTMSAVSSYASIHEDITNLAEEKRITLILLPFHKQLGAEGTLEVTNTTFKDINQNVMQDAPCSVGIFVDRGLGSLTKDNLRIVMIFIGGPDDREALSIAWRMGGHKGARICVLRLLLLNKAAEVDSLAHVEDHGILSAVTENEKQKELDEDYVNSFRLKAVNNEDSITYLDKEIHNIDDITLVLQAMDQCNNDLYIVGQGKNRNYMVLSQLMEWSDCPELGAIGDMIASDSFGSNSSLLVVQQYGSGRMNFGLNTQNASNIYTREDDGSETVFVKAE